MEGCFDLEVENFEHEEVEEVKLMKDFSFVSGKKKKSGSPII